MPYGRHASASAATFARYGGGEDCGVRVDVVEHDAVDADRGVGAGIIDHSRVRFVGSSFQFHSDAPGVSAFDRAIEIVPMIEHPQGHLRAHRRRRGCEMSRRVWTRRRKAKAP